MTVCHEATEPKQHQYYRAQAVRKRSYRGIMYIITSSRMHLLYILRIYM